MSLVYAPTITDSVNQSFFIEALTGQQNPVSYLDSFPSALYTKAVDSLLVQFLYALLGPAGAGLVTQGYLEERLQAEMGNLQGVDLDNLYSNAFSFARAADETYTIDAQAYLLPLAQRAEILDADSAFRNRAIDFLKGARGGTTLTGLTLVAKSGLNRPVELVENYRALFDQYSDSPLGLTVMGSTKSVDEVLVIPRQNAPQNAVQSLSLSGNPVQGWFTITYPATQLWTAIPVTTYSGSPTITVPSAANFPAGVFITLTNLPITSTPSEIDPTQPGWNHATLYAQSNGGTGTSVSLVEPLSGSTPGNPMEATSTGNFIALVGLTETLPLPYNVDAATLQNALTALPLIGSGNVFCSGGPFPTQPIIVEFVNNLGDQSVATLQVNLGIDLATGIGTTSIEPMADIFNSTSTIKAVTTVEESNFVSSPTQYTVVSPLDENTMYEALAQTQPLTALFTTLPGQSDVFQQVPASQFIGAYQVEVLRYVTGRNIQWPSVDENHWIEANIEHEAPSVYGLNSQYQGFHNIANIFAYTEQALTDSLYSSNAGKMNLTYWNSLVGGYLPQQLALYPGLSGLNPNNYTNQYLPPDAQAPQAEVLVISDLNGEGVINQNYPVDYMNLPGVPQPSGGLLWASLQRPSGVDYLEIDLGTTQAVNYLYFEATNKPYLIDVAFDTLDQAPLRNFVEVTIAPMENGSSVLSLGYQPTQLWSPVTINFTNAIGGMIYTRFIRIGFTKIPVGTVFGPLGTTPIPYSIEVRNLRVGRNVS